MSRGRLLLAATIAALAMLLSSGADAANAPSVPTVQYTYHAFGFAISTQMGVVMFAREGQAHEDPSGRIVASLVTPASSAMSHVIYDSQYDDRNVAGGITPTGAIILFFGRYDAINGHWVDMGYVRSTDAGQTWSTYATVPTAQDTIFSPYGPLVVLPSGRLMQTTYGTNGRTHSVHILASDDDGITWRLFSTVTRTVRETPTESAALLVGGTNNSDARILVVARTASRGHLQGGLTQYESSDGGRTWIRRGRIFRSHQVGDVSPWMIRRADGKVVLVWTDRSDCMCMRQAAADPSLIWHRPDHWPVSSVIYTSRLHGKPGRKPDHFGYPSIVNGEAVFYDITLYDHGTGAENQTVNTEFLTQSLAS